MMAAPLLVGTDLRKATPATMAIYLNRDVIAVDQDPLGVQGRVINTDGTHLVFAKPLAGGDVAVALFNEGDVAATMSTTAAQAGLGKAHGAYTVTDLWSKKATETAGQISATVPAHGTVMYRVSASSGGWDSYPPATTVSVSAPPAYPGGPVVIQPGTANTVTTTFTNSGRVPVTDLVVTLDAPAGWTVAPVTSSTDNEVGTNRSISTTWSVTAPAGTPPGSYALTATARYLWDDGTQADSSTASSQVTIISGATPEQATPVITQVSPPAASLQVLLDNPSTTPTTVTAVNWTLGSSSGTQALDTTIAPQSSATVSVDVGSPSFGQIYPFKVTSVVSGGQGSSASLSGHVTFLPVVQKDLGSSWSLSDVQDGPSVDLGSWGAVGSSQPPAGLGGKVWFDWDSTNLYVTADITDNNFSEPATGSNIWQGDSLQVAVTSGVPGSSATVSTSSTEGHYEYGAALTPQGAQVYRWTAPTGQATGPVTDAAVHVTRDDATNTTLYELALPWSDLTSVQPVAGSVFSISVLLNDTDNGVREGFLQWGGGIGSSKDVAQFNMAQLMP